MVSKEQVWNPSHLPLSQINHSTAGQSVGGKEHQSALVWWWYLAHQYTLQLSRITVDKLRADDM